MRTHLVSLLPYLFFPLSSILFSTLFGASRIEYRKQRISGEGQSLIRSELLLMGEQGTKATLKQWSFHG